MIKELVKLYNGFPLSFQLSTICSDNFNSQHISCSRTAFDDHAKIPIGQAHTTFFHNDALAHAYATFGELY